MNSVKINCSPSGKPKSASGIASASRNSAVKNSFANSLQPALQGRWAVSSPPEPVLTCGTCGRVLYIGNSLHSWALVFSGNPCSCVGHLSRWRLLNLSYVAFRQFELSVVAVRQFDCGTLPVHPVICAFVFRDSSWEL